MLLKYFYDDALAHASYMVGCQKTNEAIIIDPGRDIGAYLAAAEEEEMRIVGAAETHIHADYVSGARELATQIGARLYVSDEGDADWKYKFAAQYDSQLLKDGDSFTVGNIKLEVLHTPGHTPESISFLLTDMGGGANRPMGIFSGDFVFVGSIGRPDLLEEAAGIMGSADDGARAMFRSLERFKALPDYLQVWPAHGAGSACGKGLGAIPSSTVGYEKLFNPALQYADEEEFVAYLLSEQPEAPTYFAVMKRVNKEGPALLSTVGEPTAVAPSDLQGVLDAGTLIIDSRTPEAFAAAHVPGTLNIPQHYLASWAGWLVNYDKPLVLISPAAQRLEDVRILRKIGIDKLVGLADANAIAAAGLYTEAYTTGTPETLADDILHERVTLIDVRNQTEWDAGHLPHAQHVFLGHLPEKLTELVNGKPIVVQCRSGGRSAVGASLLQAAGAEQVINLAGGINAWQAAGLPIVE